MLGRDMMGPVWRPGALGWLALVACVGWIPATARAATRADRDGDKIYDSLQAPLGGRGAVPVVVSVNGAVDARRVARITRAVGDTATTRRLPIVHAFAK